MKDSRKILLFSRDPGGANTVFPLAGPLREKGHEVLLYGKDMALRVYATHGLAGLDIKDFLSGFGKEEIENWLAMVNPDFVITGTSAYDFTEKYIWHAAKKLGIPSFAILDSWINYGLRFSDYTIFETEKYDRDREYPFLPDKIMVMDEYAKEEMEKLGFDGAMLSAAGHPYFEELLRLSGNFLSEDRTDFRKKLGIKASDFLITFASEPISAIYKEEDGSGLYWGYDEKTILEALIEALEKIAPESARGITLLIKLHPKEDSAGYAGHGAAIQHDKLMLLFNKDADSLKLMLSSDLICGMGSMFLTEAAIIGKPVISVQIGLRRESPFILDKRSILKSVLTSDELLEKLRKAIINGNAEQGSFDIIRNPVNNIMLKMEECLCRN